VFCHSWHFRILFSGQISKGNILRPGGLIYLFSASLWETNLRFLQAEIKRISFDDILQPTTHTNEELHYNRRDLVLLHDGVIETLSYIPKGVVEWYETNIVAVAADQDIFISTPSKTLDRILVDEEKLSKFLMDSFQLLLSTLSTRDSQTSLEQATRGQRLTQLAFIYVPLSFITGIYGMNLKEINGSPLSVWVMVVSAVISECKIPAYPGLVARQARISSKSS
jgi:CorA-like Mg2+ transporter protein